MYKAGDDHNLGLTEENDWNSTNISPFNFDDASVELAQLRQIVDDVGDHASWPHDNDSGDDFDDFTSFGTGKTATTSAINLSANSARYANLNVDRPLAASTPAGTANRVFSSPTLSEQHLSIATKSHNRTGSNASSTDGFSITLLSETGQKSIDHTRLESEYNKLKLKFEQMRRDKYRPADIKDTVRRLMNCEPCTLEMYKSKKDKLSLLDSALELADGSVITAVLLYIRQSLSYALFQELLLVNAIAANHYLTYLRDHFKYDELVTTLFSIGRKEEAALIEYNQAAKKRDATSKMQKIKKSIDSTFRIDPCLNHECRIAVEYCDLLERQLPIEVADSKIIADSKDSKDNKANVFKQFPKTTTLIDQSLLTTLYYCCLYHYEMPITSSCSPLSIKAHYQLSDKQYCWVAVKALSRRKCWMEIQKLLTSKNFYGATRLKSPIAYEKLLAVLSQQGATPEILSIYIRQISDSVRKLELALKFKCHHVVVDCYVEMKDRQALIDYRAKLTSHTTEARYAESAMQNSVNLLNYSFL